MGRNNKKIPDGLPKTCLKAVADSAKTYGLFNAYFNEEFYDFAMSTYNGRDFGHERLLYAVVGVARVLESLEVSKLNRPPHENLTKFLSEDFSGIFDSAQIVRRFKDYFTARIDIKFVFEKTVGDFQILNVFDPKAQIFKEEQSAENAASCVIFSYSGKLEFVIGVSTRGTLQLNLRGLDIHDSANSSKRIPYWIDYTKLTVDGKLVFDNLTPVWHDDFCRYDITNIQAGREIKIQVEWLPHRSDT